MVLGNLKTLQVVDLCLPSGARSLMSYTWSTPYHRCQYTQLPVADAGTHYQREKGAQREPSKKRPEHFSYQFLDGDKPCVVQGGQHHRKLLLLAPSDFSIYFHPLSHTPRSKPESPSTLKPGFIVVPALFSSHGVFDLPYTTSDLAVIAPQEIAVGAGRQGRTGCQLGGRGEMTACPCPAMLLSTLGTQHAQRTPRTCCPTHTHLGPPLSPDSLSRLPSYSYFLWAASRSSKTLTAFQLGEGESFPVRIPVCPGDGFWLS
ncbi:uncharacterized protein LOC111812862 [Octodon degus]|uniref:Uncharacterized protein LOC111812862 n=1 Tax=Octodon degus TaxID=10160 RepID=A0A6P6DEC1_OCTDE|nr:uncharacterized protein LOC111812862 [Octodon degus]